MTGSPPGGRFSLVRLPSAGGGSFADDVRAGLSASPKILPPKYFYDELGSLLFEAICALPEYYVTRAEAEILAARAGEIVAGLEPPVGLVELGSGSSAKTRHLIEALLARQERLEYTPIDISESALRGSAEGLLRAYPGLAIRAFAGDYLATLAALPEREAAGAGSLLVLFLGSTIGNLAPEEGVELLRAVRSRLRPGDGLLLGTDLKKSGEVLVPAYDDPLGVTAAFNLNLLVRINRELGGELDLRKFFHRAVWDEERGRVEMHIVSREAQRVAVRGLAPKPAASGPFEVGFEAGEAILSECSYKFDPAGVAALAEAAGFVPAQRWTDAAGLFGSNLLLVV
jgi:dimethylhistidine N-methyltransferase